MPLPLGVVAVEGKSTDPWWITQNDAPGINGTSDSSGGAGLAYDIAGNTYYAFSYGSNSIGVRKQSPRGVVIWSKTYPTVSGASANQFLGIVVDSAQNVYIATSRSNVLFTYFYKLDINGTPVWARSLSGTVTNLDLVDMALDNAENLIIKCRQTTSSTQKGIEVLKVNTSTGNIIWQTRYAHTNVQTQLNCFSNIAIDSSNSIFIFTAWQDSTFNTIFGGVTKFNSSGVPVWQNALYNGNTTSQVGIANETVLAVDSLGAIYATQRQPGGSSVPNLRIMKFNTSGNVVWANTLNGTVNFPSSPLTALCDSSNNLYLTAFHYDSGNAAYEMLFTKYNTTTGSPIWQRGLQPGGLTAQSYRGNSPILNNQKSFFGSTVLFGSNRIAAYAKVPLNGTGQGTYTQDAIGWLYQNRTIGTGTTTITDNSLLQTHFTGNLAFAVISNPTATNLTAPTFTINLNV